MTRLAAFWRKHQTGIVAALMVAIFLVVSVAQYEQSRQNNRDSYNRCINRNVNINQANLFYRRMAALEAQNKFIDAKLRAARVYLYSHQVFTPPKCGTP